MWGRARVLRAPRIPLPTLVSESARAIASHFQRLVFDVLGAGQVSGAVPPLSEGEPRDCAQLARQPFGDRGRRRGSSGDHCKRAGTNAIKVQARRLLRPSVSAT